MTIHNIDGIDYVHIIEFAKATGRQVTSTRHLIEDGNVERRLKAIRIRSALYIVAAEVYGYPFAKDGKIFHYNEKGERYLCETCTFTNDYCEARETAESIDVPENIY